MIFTKEKVDEGYACNICGHDARVTICVDRHSAYCCSNTCCENRTRLRLAKEYNKEPVGVPMGGFVHGCEPVKRPDVCPTCGHKENKDGFFDD